MKRSCKCFIWVKSCKWSCYDYYKKKQKVNISVNSALLIGQIDKSTFVNYQQDYGAGVQPNMEEMVSLFDALMVRMI
jgi:hypothetical protein